MKRNQKWKISHTVLRDKPCASAHIKITNTVMSWNSRKKKEGTFCTVCFFKICFLSQCIVY